MNKTKFDFKQLLDRKINLLSIGLFQNDFEDNWLDGILDFEIGKSFAEFREIKLNFFETFWAMIVRELKMFGVADSVLRKLNRAMHSNVLIELLESELPGERINEKLKEMTGFEFDLNDKYQKQAFISELKNAPDTEKIYQTYLGSLLACMILENGKPVFHIFSNLEKLEQGKRPFSFCIEGTNGFSDTLKKSTISSSSFRIPLWPIFQKMFELDMEDEVFQQLHLITDREKEVLDIVRSNEFKEITITPGNKQPKIKVINNGTIKGEKVKEIRKLLGSKEYQSVDIKFRNEKDLYFEKVRTIN